MITTATYLSADGVTAITLNEDNTAYPITAYNPTIDSRIIKNERSANDGIWPAFNWMGGMELEILGDILADDADDYWTKRQALVSAFRAQPTTKQRRDGVWFITFDNAPEQFKVDVAIDSFSAPRNAASPNFSSWRLVLFSWTPYYRGVDSDSVYYDD